MKALERLFAEKLLKVKAVKIQPANPFTWAASLCLIQHYVIS